MSKKRRPLRGNPKRVVGYVRVSTEDQALGPIAQRSALDAWCERNGCIMTAVFEDIGVSGGAELDKRPGMLLALEALTENGAGVLLVVKRDRLARDVVLAGMLERLVENCGARIDSADGVGVGDGPESQLMRSIVDAFAQYERALIRFRTKSALAVKRGRQERIGGIAYGKQVSPEGKLTDNAAELQAVARVRELKQLGHSLRGIAQRLTTEGFQCRGTKWHKTTIERLLARTDVRAPGVTGHPSG